jgi:hypothetical protein
MWMKRLLRSAHNVGILLAPAHNQRRAAETAARQRAGCAPVLKTVIGPAALPNAPTRPANSVAVLYVIRDSTSTPHPAAARTRVVDQPTADRLPMKRDAA